MEARRAGGNERAKTMKNYTAMTDHGNFYRKSETKQFTHAVIFCNKTDNQLNATFHVSMKLANAEKAKMDRRDWLEFIEIVTVKELVAA
jgi:hypothetical protein